MHCELRDVFQQSPEERRLKYWIAREYAELPTPDCRKFRDWRWDTFQGVLTIYLTQTNKAERIPAVIELCQDGYNTFKGAHGE